MMRLRRRGDGRGVDGLGEFIERTHRARAALRGNVARGLRVRVEHGRQLAIRQLRQDARVVFPDVAEAGDADA